jgi:hypothetical protein
VKEFFHESNDIREASRERPIAPVITLGTKLDEGFHGGVSFLDHVVFPMLAVVIPASLGPFLKGFVGFLETNAIGIERPHLPAVPGVRAYVGDRGGQEERQSMISFLEGVQKRRYRTPSMVNVRLPRPIVQEDRGVGRERRWGQEPVRTR